MASLRPVPQTRLPALHACLRVVCACMHQLRVECVRADQFECVLACANILSVSVVHSGPSAIIP
jgi:hypothetical protein